MIDAVFQLTKSRLPESPSDGGDSGEVLGFSFAVVLSAHAIKRRVLCNRLIDRGFRLIQM